MLESWGCGLYTSAAYTRVFTVLVFIDIKSSTKLLQKEMLAKFPNVPIEWG